MTQSTSSGPAPTLVWLRRDLRLSDNPALASALDLGGPVIPVWILDPETEALGAAHRWRLEASLRSLSQDLTRLGARLILRSGPALTVLRSLARGAGARAVRWNRLYDSAARTRDEEAKAALRDDGLDVESCNGALLHEPWEVATKEGGFYKVYSPYWRAVSELTVHEPIPAPSRWPAPAKWPRSDDLADLRLGADMNRGAEVVARHVHPGEAAAQDRLAAFLDDQVQNYSDLRDRPDRAGTSALSDHLATGEISPRRIWTAARARRQGGKADPVTKFMQELVWREFAYHLLHHTPEIETRNWRREFDAFPWRDDPDALSAWQRGLTGIDMIDAAMRELFVTGRMHNRCRMLVASFLTKHLLIHWKAGEAWFRDTLIDWDPANNALGWQWVAGCGPDAAPYFRIFNPETQAGKFDPEARYRDRFLGDHDDARAFFQAIPRSWGLSPADPRPRPIVDLKGGRERALEAYQTVKSGRDAA